MALINYVTQIQFEFGAIGLLGWGWRIRSSRPGIALPTQGAALATLMLVTFGAFKIYHLLPSGPTFALLLVLVAFTCVLACSWRLRPTPALLCSTSMPCRRSCS